MTVCCNWSHRSHQQDLLLTFPGSINLSPEQCVAVATGDSLIAKHTLPFGYNGFIELMQSSIMSETHR
jgi:hypothetical protein